MSQPPKKRKLDSVPIGAITGIVSPILFFIGYYFVRYHKMPFGAYLRYLTTGSILIPIFSLCVYPNLLVFFSFIWTDRDKSSRGVVLTTILITIVVGILKSLGK
jgi:hypothetical protein